MNKNIFYIGVILAVIFLIIGIRMFLTLRQDALNTDNSAQVQGLY